MAGEEITVLQFCGNCNSEVGSFSVKKDNLMLTSRESIWCPTCNANHPEVRDLAGRRASIQKEVDSLPRAGSP